VIGPWLKQGFRLKLNGAKGKRLWTLLAPFGLGLGFLGAFQVSGIGESLNLLIYDTAVVLRPAPSGARWPIRLIGLTEADIRRFGWPLSDVLLVRAIDRLRADGVQAIGVDFYRDKGVDPGADLLRQHIRSHPEIVTIFNVAASIPSPPGTPTQQKSFNDLIVDADGVVRRDLLHVEGQPPDYVSLPLRLFELSKGDQTCLIRLRVRPWSGPGFAVIQGATADRMRPDSSACCPFTSPIVSPVGVSATY